MPSKLFLKTKINGLVRLLSLIFYFQVSEGLSVDDILENWSQIKPVIMGEWGEDKDFLVDLFGKIRDEWMDSDLTTWIGANR